MANENIEQTTTKKVNPCGISDEDLNFLVSVCARCDVIVKKEYLFIKKRYFYFVTQEEKQIGQARNILRHCGIKMEKHKSRINGGPKPQVVLRVEKYKVPEDKQVLLRLIEQKRQHIFSRIFLNQVDLYNGR